MILISILLFGFTQNKPPGGLHYRRVGGCGQCLGAEENAAREASHTSGARYVRRFYCARLDDG